MKLVLSLSVLAVALLMVLEGPAPAQAESGIMDDLKALGNSMKVTVQKTIETVKETEAWKWISGKFSEATKTIKSKFS